MTIRQVEKIKYFIKKLCSVTNCFQMFDYVAELKGYFAASFDINVKATRWNTADSYKADYLRQDKEVIKAFLERKIDEDKMAGQISRILDLIEEGESARGNQQKMEEFIAKIYHSYSGIISFNDVVKAIATQHGVPGLQVYKADEAILDGVISKLCQYADILSNQRIEKTQTQPQNVFNISNTANANSSATLNSELSIVIETAKQQAEDAGLSDEQFESVMQKINELEEIAKSKESRGKRWQKAKEIMKWLVEQGIQVAAILVPVLSTCIK